MVKAMNTSYTYLEEIVPFEAHSRYLAAYIK
jgi:hypothetical protein